MKEGKGLLTTISFWMSFQCLKVCIWSRFDFEFDYIYKNLLIFKLDDYSRVRNKHTPTFINFWNFFQGLPSYCGLKRLKFYYISLHILRGYPSFIYSWSIGHILEHEFFCLGHLGCAGSKEKKWIWVFLSNF